jgi:hypothetical protein
VPSEGLCFSIPQNQTVDIDVEATNPIQADSRVVSVRGSKSTSGAAELQENLQFEFDSAAEARLVWLVIAGLLFAALLIPLGLLYLLNMLTTKFLPISQMVRAEYPVKVQTGPATKILDQKGNPIVVDANDFRPLTEQAASRTLDLGQKGNATSKLPLFPLATTWFEHQAPQGSRVISIFNGGSKSPNHFVSGRAAEISPNHADNWQLIIPEAEFGKSEGAQMDAVLIVGSRMSNLTQYQNKTNEISSHPGLQRRVSEIRASLAEEKAKPTRADKGSRSSNGPRSEKSGGVGTNGLIPGASNPSIPGASNPSFPDFKPPQ